MAAKKKKEAPAEYFILMGYATVRGVFKTPEDLVEFAESHPYPYSGEVLRYVEGDDCSTQVSTYSRLKMAMESADRHGEA